MQSETKKDLIQKYEYLLNWRLNSKKFAKFSKLHQDYLMWLEKNDYKVFEEKINVINKDIVNSASFYNFMTMWGFKGKNELVEAINAYYYIRKYNNHEEWKK